MPRTRPPYPPEFRREAIKLVRISSKSQHQIAEDLGISDVTVPRAYLVAGTQEPFFRQNAARWAHALRDAGADVVTTERAGSHGDAFWREEFPLMVAWAFGR